MSEDQHAADIDERLAALKAENERLRAEYRRAMQSRYHNAAKALAVLGVVAVGFSLVLPGSRDVLMALAATGFFGAVLIYYLTPDRLLVASLAEHTITTYGANLNAQIDELGLEETFVYVPRGEFGDVRLFLPQHAQFEIPDESGLEETFIVSRTDEERGVALDPVGEAILGDVSSYPPRTDAPASVFATTLTEILVEVLEIADSVEVQGEAGDLIFTWDGGLAATGEYPDNPLMSVIGTGMATHVGRPVSLTVEQEAKSVRCRWETPDSEN